MYEIHHISPEKVNFKKIEPILAGNVKLALSEDSKARIIKCRNYLDDTYVVFDFEGDVYGKYICVELVEFIRAEKKFDDFGELKAQILKDAEQARGML